MENSLLIVGMAITTEEMVKGTIKEAIVAISNTGILFFNFILSQGL